MKEKSIEQFKKLVADFRVKKDNQIKSKNLKETNQVSEYQKLYLEYKTLKKYSEQQ